MKSSTFTIVAVVAGVYGQRPSTTSICDYYTNALFGANNATSQLTLLTALVNTAVIGNYTTPNQNAVPGILSPTAKYNGTAVNLAKYFDGSLKSTNTGKGQGASVNFLDGGGAAPLKANKAGDDPKSHQYTLLTHLYSYFGYLLGCSQIGKEGFATYSGDTSMYDVHKYMDLDANEVQYFIQQVGLAATSFGVAAADAEAVGKALQDLFVYKCSPKTSVNYQQKPELQAICIADDCRLSPNATCAAYGDGAKPASTSTDNTSGGAASSSSSSSSSSNGVAGLSPSLWMSVVSLVLLVVFAG